MASYHDEHDVDDTARDASFMNMVRILLSGNREILNLLPDSGDLGVAPPASKDAVKNLIRRPISEDEFNSGAQCPVCLVPYKKEETVIEMPCEHMFHNQCILPWLEKTNSCPNCRDELPTDNEEYEENKREKEEERARELRVEEFHNSMFG